MIIFLALVILILVLTNALTIYLLIRSVNLISNYENKVNTSTLIVEQSLVVLEELLERPLLMDTPEVREVLELLKAVRKAIMTIADTLEMLDIVEETKEEKK